VTPTLPTDDAEPIHRWVLCWLDGDAAVLRVEGMPEEVLGLSAEEAVGRRAIDFIRREDVHEARRLWHEVMAVPDATRTGRQILVRPDGREHWVETTTIHRPGEDGPELLFLVHDISAERAHLLIDIVDRPARRGGELVGEEPEDIADHAAERRAGLVDRDELAQVLAAALKEEPERTLVVSIDLDGFSTLNERHGREAGEAVLREVGRRVHELLRPLDVVARYGGDDFVVVCRGVGDGAAPALCRRIGEALRVPIELPAGDWVPAASIGTARPLAGEDAGSVMARADHAMLLAKRERRAERFFLGPAH
jgi:diguanylate cyclase (GGDEF)-like protein/PAS domain S-box-containing protein